MTMLAVELTHQIDKKWAQFWREGDYNKKDFITVLRVFATAMSHTHTQTHAKVSCGMWAKVKHKRVMQKLTSFFFVVLLPRVIVPSSA